MCGIAGIYNQQQTVTQPSLQPMATALAHRGPNGEGFYINSNHTLGLAHRRLAVIDLSQAAAQPLHYANRYTIIHNGEVYNYIELKQQLQQLGLTFTTLTDTEVIVAAYHQYGANCLQLFEGMFAFAIYDEQEQQLFIARDRFGEKPLYYYTNDTSFYFASEMKALWAASVPKQLHHSMLALYLGLGYTQIPLQPEITFYQNIYSLPPAHYLTLQLTNFTVTQHQYWDIDKETKSTLTQPEAIEQFDALLTKSIKQTLRSDIAIGTSLSGGLDSSSIVAYMHQLGIQNTATYSAVYNNYANNESTYIHQVQQHCTTNSQYTYPTANGLVQDFAALIATQEQPFVSSSVYAQYQVYALAKQHHTQVLIDGQGADETMGGYQKYLHWYLQELYLYDKQKFKQEYAALQQNNAVVHWGLRNRMASWFPGAAATQLQKKAHNQLQWHSGLAHPYIDAHYTKLFVYKPLVKKLNDLLYFNTMQFGLQDLLRYADKNAMAHGVEVRLPYLNHQLVQYIYSLPSHYKIHQGFQKYILRKAVEQKLPTAITWRTNKIGFETPQQDWLTHYYFTEKIQAAKQLLISKGIMDKSILQSNKPEQNWRIMIAAEYLEN